MHGETPLQIIAAHQRHAPVNVELVARDLGLPIYYSTLDRNIKGKLIRRNQGFAIVINSLDTRLRQRFTIAHEIAHYVLHRDLMNVEIVDHDSYQSMLSSDYESQANRLAVDILMPGELVRQEFAENPDPRALAKHFWVSEKAMEIRLKGLHHNRVALAG
ncbi:MAG TPA: ImmA/IrrE family metallo-endopeptidase [Stellaceae bacterium]|nr:ImmA/IrrE family metallo-endopeptidase [Stellaceae bacterium]